MTKTKKIRTNAKVLKQLNFFGKLPRFSVRVIASQINRQLNRFVKHMVRLEQVAFYKISAKCLPHTALIIFEANQEELSETKTISTKRNVDTRVLLFGCERPDPSSKVISTAFWIILEKPSIPLFFYKSPSEIKNSQNLTVILVVSWSSMTPPPHPRYPGRSVWCLELEKYLNHQMVEQCANKFLRLQKC